MSNELDIDASWFVFEAVRAIERGKWQDERARLVAALLRSWRHANQEMDAWCSCCRARVKYEWQPIEHAPDCIIPGLLAEQEEAK